jgi:23S rRNA pseudouridine1911/1915/1917 synthase
MTTRGSGGREAITHYLVRKRIESDFGKFTLLELKIDTGRTHQIRVHLSSLGHPVVGDVLYGAAREIKAHSGKEKGRAADPSDPTISLRRNFLHAAALELRHPRTGDQLSFARGLPQELETFLEQVQGQA